MVVRIVKPLAIRARLGSVCGFSSGLDSTNFSMRSISDALRARFNAQSSILLDRKIRGLDWIHG